jgi:hypothetical protein
VEYTVGTNLDLEIDIAEFFRGEDSFPTEPNEGGESLAGGIQ